MDMMAKPLKASTTSILGVLKFKVLLDMVLREKKIVSQKYRNFLTNAKNHFSKPLKNI